METNEAKRSNEKRSINQTIHELWSAKPLKSEEDFNPNDENAENESGDNEEEKCGAASCNIHDLDKVEDPQWIECGQCKTWFDMFCAKLTIIPDHYFCLDHSSF